MFSKDGLKDSLKNYFANILLIWIAILFYRTNDYYFGFLRQETQTALLCLAIIYTIFGLFFYTFPQTDLINHTKGRIFLRTLKRISKEYYVYIRGFYKSPWQSAPKLDKHEKIAILFLIVKLFFLPIMLNFMFNNYYAIKGLLGTISTTNDLFIMNSLLNIIYPFIIAIIFFIDTLYFSFGYALEAKFLNNALKSVEPTIIGWLVTLICYPPFNGLLSNYVVWYADNMVSFSTPLLTFSMRAIIVFFLLVYLSATIALGTKCSNLTNRGIVSTGIYGIIRHPAYISKIIAWWIMIVPILTPSSFFSMLFWTGIYFVRAITEERHLIQDKDYAEYCKKVKYRFIPYVF